jgi:hypothetical protein
VPDSHSGVSVQLAAGWIFDSGLVLSGLAVFGFPQISTWGQASDVSFQSHALGIEAGWLFLGRLEPTVRLMPWAELTQMGVANPPSYGGLSYGAGLKVYLSERRGESGQVGLRALYARDEYTRVVSTGEQRITGDSFNIGVFLGI